MSILDELRRAAATLADAMLNAFSPMSAHPRPGVVDDGLATTAPTPGHFREPVAAGSFARALEESPYLAWGRSESDGPDLTQGSRPVGAARSDFRGCNCDSHHAADLDDHQPRCGAHIWARTHRIVSAFLAEIDAFPTHELLDAMAARLTDAIHPRL